LSYIASIKKNIQQSFVFEGRSSAQEYWRYMGLYTALLFGSNFVRLAIEYFPAAATKISAILSLFQLLISLPTLGLTFRRLHDVNKSAWWQLLFITIVGIIPITYWLAKKSFPDENKYGAVPNDANSSNFFRNLGLGILTLYYVFLGYGIFSAFNQFANWDVENSQENNVKISRISRLFSETQGKGLFIKVTFQCIDKNDVLVALSTFRNLNDVMTPLQIKPMADSYAATSVLNSDRLNFNKIKFETVPDTINVIGTVISKNDLLALTSSNFSVAIDTNSGRLVGKVDATDNMVKNFIGECKN